MDAPVGWDLLATLKGHEASIGRLAWSRDGTLLATPGLDGMLMVWEVQTGKPIRVVRHAGALSCAAFSPDGGRVACGFADPFGPAVLPGYLYPDEFGEEPLPEGIDELLGAYDQSTEWDSDRDAPEGAVIPVAIADIADGEWVASFYASQITQPVLGLAWPGDGRAIFTTSGDGVCRWQTRTGQLLEVDREGGTRSIEFAPGEAQYAASGPFDWDRKDLSGEVLESGWLSDEVAWAEEGESFTDIATATWGTAVGTETGTIVVSRAGRPLQYLEGHTKAITSLSASSDGRLLASKSLDGSVRVWDCTTWEVISILHEPARGQADFAGIAFAPSGHRLATLGPAGKVARIWDLDIATILSRREITPTVHYSNAKVVLLGDSGVGKTGLGLVLAGEQFRPTESSHRRNVWLFDTQESTGNQPERREVYLWDLAGQPGYRLLHQLYLSDAAVAVILFDAKSEQDPFAGVRHWVKALRQAGREGRFEATRILVAARMDRGGPQVTDERLESVVREFGFRVLMETSAKEQRGIEELREAILSAIPWADLPKVSSTGLFDSIKAFLVAERDRNRLLVTGADLRQAYASTRDGAEKGEDITAEFDTCVGRVAARGIIRRLSFGGLVLLKPEVLDAYAASLTMAARDQPDGMGSISEEAARRGEFAIPAEDRLEDADVEHLLLTATVEEVLRHEVALRENSDDGPYLVFPTQSRREALPLRDSQRVVFSIGFEGQIQTVYATLVVRLAHSGIFEREETFRNAATFKRRDAVLGISVEEPNEGEGLLRIFAGEEPDEQAASWMIDYVIAHVQRRAVPESVSLSDSVNCGGCGLEFSAEILDAARARGKSETTCPVCDARVDISVRISIGEHNELVVKKMDVRADEEAARAAATAALHGKEEVGEFDVFLAHNSEDRPSVLRLAENLRSFGINPWVDDEQIPPGRWFQDAIEVAIGRVGAAAIVIGPSGLGPWESVELKAFVAECVERGLPVIPVLLPEATIPRELKILKQLRWVRFEDDVDEERGLEQLRWGITGRSPASMVVHKSFTTA